MERDGDGLGVELERALAAVEAEPMPEPSPTPCEVEPCASPSPSPSASPDALVALVQAVHDEQQHQTVAQTGTFYGVCILITLVVAAVLLSVLRRKG